MVELRWVICVYQGLAVCIFAQMFGNGAQNFHIFLARVLRDGYHENQMHGKVVNTLKIQGVTQQADCRFQAAYTEVAGVGDGHTFADACAHNVFPAVHGVQKAFWAVQAPALRQNGTQIFEAFRLGGEAINDFHKLGLKESVNFHSIFHSDWHAFWAAALCQPNFAARFSKMDFRVPGKDFP